MNSLLPLQLVTARGIGDVFIRRFADFVLRYGESDGFRIVNSVKELSAVFGINATLQESIVNAQCDAELLLKKLEREKIGVVWLADSRYPKCLKSILGKDAPSILFYRGNFELCDMLSVGFCGSRNASEKGLTITKDCVSQMIQRNIVIVSGYARGVDMTAHCSALREKGKTIIVLAEGLFHFAEKQEIKGLLDSENHLIVSQFSPNAVWNGRNAMCRNSTIIAFSDAMVLIESRLQGGTYAAGKECLRRHHPLFVIDFAKPDNSATANFEFIKNGGLPIRSKGGKPNLERLFLTLEN
jgi:DNA protecting protein DprA